MDSREDELVDELLLEVLDDHALSTEGESLLLDLSEVLLLADIGKEGNDLVSLEVDVISLSPRNKAQIAKHWGWPDYCHRNSGVSWYDSCGLPSM